MISSHGKGILIRDNHRCKKGFTLIELLVVFAIIGVIATTTLLSYSPPLFQDTKDRFLELQSKIYQAQEKALLSGSPYGILFFHDRFIFLKVSNRKWGLSEFGETEMDLISAELVVEGTSIAVPLFDDEQVNYNPQIVFFPSASMSEFKLSITRTDETRGENALFELESDVLGRAEFSEIRSQF